MCTPNIHHIFAIFYGNRWFITMYTAAPYFPHPEPDVSNTLSLNPHLKTLFITLAPKSGTTKLSYSFRFPHPKL